MSPQHARIMRNARPTSPKCVHESDILKPRDPSLDQNDCAEFVLNNAYVTYESNHKPASVLLAFPDTPLRVQGRLAAPSREHSHFRMSCPSTSTTRRILTKLAVLEKPFRSVDIYIHNVTQYSYAEMDDQTYNIWALGEAGWFEIQPGARYEGVYADMIEAVGLLYFVADIYEESEPRKKGGGPSAALLYQEVSRSATSVIKY